VLPALERLPAEHLSGPMAVFAARLQLLKYASRSPAKQRTVRFLLRAPASTRAARRWVIRFYPARETDG
jgi:hypothetical protein